MSQLYMPFDSETGGVNENTADMLTLYTAIMDDEYKILDELYMKLKPDGGRLPIAEAQALAVNGIDLKAHLEDPETITYSEAKDKLVTMIKKHLVKKGRFSNISPYGYNVPFDKRWTQKHVLSQNEWEAMLHYKDVDVMQNVDMLKRAGWFPRDLGSLNTVVDFLGLPKRNAHNAKEDTLMTIDVDKKLQEIMRSKKDGGATQDLISLLEAE